jgi:hypothetical protein
MLIGNKNIFAIEYILIDHPYGDETGIMHDSWGTVKLWVKGEDLMAFDIFGGKKDEIYQWNLIYMVEWFARNYKEILFNTEFLYGIEANNTYELLDIYDAKMPKFGEPFYGKWHDARLFWVENHNFRHSIEGTPLPDLFIRRTSNSIEFLWDNSVICENKSFIFKSLEGCEYIDATIVEQVISGFLNDFITRFEHKYPEEMQQLREYMLQ